MKKQVYCVGVLIAFGLALGGCDIKSSVLCNNANTCCHILTGPGLQDGESFCGSLAQCNQTANGLPSKTVGGVRYPIVHYPANGDGVNTIQGCVTGTAAISDNPVLAALASEGRSGSFALPAFLLPTESGRFVFVATSIPPGKHMPAGPEVCDKECATGGTFCLRLDAAQVGDLGRSIASARTLLAKEGDAKIATQEFMSLFNQKADPCNRGDTIMAAGELTNSGDACKLAATLQAASRQLAVNIRIPKLLVGSRKLEGGALLLLFPNSAHAPVVRSDDPEVDADYGGAVQRILSRPGEAIVSTQRACIDVTFATE